MKLAEAAGMERIGATSLLGVMTRVLVAVMVLGCWYEGREARAEGFVGQFGLGLAKVGKLGDGGSEQQRGSGSDVRFSLDVGYRLNCRIALGGHLAWTTGQQTDLDVRDLDSTYYEEAFSIVELGFAPQILLDRLWLAPWAGLVYISADDIYLAAGLELAYGLSLGVDLYTSKNQGVGIFMSGYVRDGFTEPSEDYALGFSYRHR
jgi:hypothetical protein